MEKTVLITGNTYPVRSQLRALEGQWDARAQGWRVPEDAADTARRIVELGYGAVGVDAPERSAPVRGRRPAGTWCPCGARGCKPGACENCDGEGYRSGGTRAA